MKFSICSLVGLLALSFSTQVLFAKGALLDSIPNSSLSIIGLPNSYLEKEVKWVDSVYNRMTIDQRVGQLLMLRAHSNKGPQFELALLEQIKHLQPGGLCFFQGNISRQAKLTNQYQAASSIPLLVSMDAEYGLGMRLSDGITYPRQMTLGALRDDVEIYQYGQEMARQCRRLGVHISFSPSADINNNPSNPVINDRSFGDDRVNVAKKATQYMKGLQDGGVMACAKHFPGHGDTDVDSHHALPVIKHPQQRLDSLELYPFKALIKEGVASFMVAHLNIPSFEPDPKRPSTLSKNVITGLLREQLGFEGLIFTDAMEMKAVADSFPAGYADVEALVAGNDIVLLPVNAEAAVSAIKTALESGYYPSQQFERSVKRVLAYKYKLQLTSPSTIDTNLVTEKINTPSALLLKRNMYRQAITLVRDRDGIAGFQDDLYLKIGKTKSTSPTDSAYAGLRLATLALGDTNLTVFQKTCAQYAGMDHFGVDTSLNDTQIKTLCDRLSSYDLVLVSQHKTRSKSKDNFGLTKSMLQLLEQLNANCRIALTVFGNPYSLRYFDQIPSLMLAYTEDPIAQEMAAQAWFGAADISGRLPVEASPAARYQQGILKIFQEKRLAYDLPESVGMQSDSLAKIDQLVQEMIEQKATPGCQVLIAKNGKIVWNKAYGHYSYDSLTPVTTETLYDLASITKVAATTLAMMKLVDNGQISLFKPLSTYLPELEKGPKKDLRLDELLIHQAGLQAWIPFYKQTLDSLQQPLSALYKTLADSEFGTPVAQNLWLKNRYTDTIWQQIIESPLRSDKSYKYSDLTMYLLARLLEYQTRQKLNVFVNEAFYQPLAMNNTLFNPWEKGWSARCAPTEEDQYFRNRTIQGYVHDMGAAMLGGVSGHAGLFSNANDLAKFAQMLLNYGSYAGKRYFLPETVRYFTTRHPNSTRRGLGFDMKETDPNSSLNMAPNAGSNTYGHLGFTGNALWVDPDQQLIFIFLSNRTYPSMNNNRLMEGNYRPRLQELVYRSIR
jgi:beta-glucosidase-like glycosyl hydrolase/CubicO group peptidase (beta-lactamase class C family)